MMIQDLANYIESEGWATVGTDLFIGTLKDSPSDVVILFETGGLPTDRYIPKAEATLQIYIRNTSYANGQSLGETITRGINRLSNVTMGSTYIDYIFLEGELGGIGRDEKNRHEFTCNLVVRYRE